MADEVESVQLSKKSVEFLRSLADEIARQDNRATARPYFFVIKTPRWRVAHDEFSTGDTKRVRVDYSGDPTEYETKEEFMKDRREYEPDVDEAALAARWEKLPEHTLERYYDEENAFFTERAFKQHVELNGHNLGRRGRDGYYDYLKHAFRNPEMDGLFKAIAEFQTEKRSSES